MSTKAQSKLKQAVVSNNIYKLDEALKEGADPNYSIASSTYGKPLKLAIIYDHENIAKHLLNNGADATAADKNGNTTLMVAVNEKQAKYIHILCDYNMLKRADVNAQNKDGETALIRACQDNNAKAAKELMTVGVCNSELKDAGGLAADDYGLEEILGLCGEVPAMPPPPRVDEVAQQEKIALDKKSQPHQEEECGLVRQYALTQEEIEAEQRYYESQDVSRLVIDQIERQKATANTGSNASVAAAQSEDIGISGSNDIEASGAIETDFNMTEEG